MKKRDTLFLNLPLKCYANCEFCSDINLKKNTISMEEWMYNLEKIPSDLAIERVVISGGTPTPGTLERIVSLFPNKQISLNTNTLADGLFEVCKKLVEKNQLQYIGLSRHAIEDRDNDAIFKTGMTLSLSNKNTIISKYIPELGKAFSLRRVIDDSLNLDEYLNAFKCNIVLNLMYDNKQSGFLYLEKALDLLKLYEYKVETHGNMVYHQADLKDGRYLRISMGDYGLDTKLESSEYVFHRNGKLADGWRDDA